MATTIITDIRIIIIAIETPIKDPSRGLSVPVCECEFVIVCCESECTKVVADVEVVVIDDGVPSDIVIRVISIVFMHVHHHNNNIVYKSQAYRYYVSTSVD